MQKTFKIKKKKPIGPHGPGEREGVELAICVDVFDGRLLTTSFPTIVATNATTSL